MSKSVCDARAHHQNILCIGRCYMVFFLSINSDKQSSLNQKVNDPMLCWFIAFSHLAILSINRLKCVFLDYFLYVYWSQNTWFDPLAKQSVSLIFHFLNELHCARSQVIHWSFQWTLVFIVLNRPDHVSIKYFKYNFEKKKV